MNILIYGSKEFGKVIKNLVKCCGYEFSGFIDDFNNGPEVIGPYKYVKDNYSNNNYSIVNAIGYKNLDAREEIMNKITSDGYQLPSIIHETAYVADNVKIGRGCIIMAHAVVDVNSIIQDGVVLWPSSVVNHDCIIGENSFLSPNSTICGCTTIGNKCFIGAGTVVVDHANIPENSFLKD